jgi:hypothetical protein
MHSDAGTTGLEPSKGRRLAVGLFLIAVGAGTIALIFLQPQQLRVPAWVAYAAASTFPLAGVVLIAGALGATRLVRWLGTLLVAGLLVPGLWTTFGPGPRDCSVYFGNIGAEASDWICRAGFGIGSIIGLAALVLLIRHAIASTVRG